MARLIDANKVAQDVRDNNRDNFYRADWTSKRVVELLENAPAVDAVEVVRCKDCKHYGKTEIGNKDRCMCTKILGLTIPRPDDFCSYGEREYNG